MRMIVEKLVEWRLAGETEVLGENLPQRHFVHHTRYWDTHYKPTATEICSSVLTEVWSDSWYLTETLQYFH
jgi:phage-related protein